MIRGIDGEIGEVRMENGTLVWDMTPALRTLIEQVNVRELDTRRRVTTAEPERWLRALPRMFCSRTAMEVDE